MKEYYVVRVRFIRSFSVYLNHIADTILFSVTCPPYTALFATTTTTRIYE